MKFLIVGGGSIGKRHIKNLHQLGYTQVACLKRKPDADFEQELGVKVVCTPEEVDQFIPDAVVICTPTSLHIEGIRLAIKYNAAIFMEKPLIHTEALLNDAMEMLHGYQQTFFLGFMLRYHPLIASIKTIIQNKELGNVFGARFEFGSYLPFWHPWEDHRTGYAAIASLGGGVINTITHELDLVLYLFGSPSSLHCMASNFGKLNIDVEELAEAVFKYDDKLLSLHVDYLQKDYDRNIKIWCDEGSITWNWHENRLAIKKHQQPVAYINFDNFDVNNLYLDEMKAFIELAQLKQIKHPLDFDYAVINTNILFNMHQSVKSGHCIECNKN